MRETCPTSIFFFSIHSISILSLFLSLLEGEGEEVAEEESVDSGPEFLEREIGGCEYGSADGIFAGGVEDVEESRLDET